MLRKTLNKFGINNDMIKAVYSCIIIMFFCVVIIQTVNYFLVKYGYLSLSGKYVIFSDRFSFVFMGLFSWVMAISMVSFIGGLTVMMSTNNHKYNKFAAFLVGGVILYSTIHAFGANLVFEYGMELGDLYPRQIILLAGIGGVYSMFKYELIKTDKSKEQ